MGVSTYIEIWCNKCGASAGTCQPGELRKTREWLGEQGWEYLRRDKSGLGIPLDLCPRCSKLYFAKDSDEVSFI